jgi:hypothetical protein
MILNCENNQTVELKIHNYEFPDTLNKDYDANWLDICLKIENADWKWETIDPSLLTWDVKALIEWFKTIANNEKPKFTEISNLEPNISFALLNEYSEKVKKFQIKLDAESRPPFAKNNAESCFIFNADEAELKRIITELESELEKFPVRE